MPQEGKEPPLIALVGPTASGKTSVGVELAQRINGEIVSADAVAVYRGLDIGSAKPELRERNGIPFHLINVAGPSDDFTLADFERLANKAIADIRARNRTPILVGGTGLYVRSVTATLSMPNVPPQPDFRADLWAESERGANLHERLEKTDPASAQKIGMNDVKRTIRALEVFYVTGQPMASFHTPEGVRGVPKPNTFVFGLEMPRPDLYARIEARVDAMMAQGFVDEVRGLLARGFGPELKSMQSLGYRHLCRVLRKEYSLSDAVAELKQDTRRYAKRQNAWFGADATIRPVNLPSEPQAEKVADELQTLLGQVNKTTV